MNYRIVFKLLGIILGSLCIAFIFSMAIACIYWEDPRESAAINGWLLVLTATAVLMLISLFLGRSSTNKVLRKEALTVIGTGWLIATIIGALPYLLILPSCQLSDAIFESASGLTTTGASVFADIESFQEVFYFGDA